MRVLEPLIFVVRAPYWWSPTLLPPILGHFIHSTSHCEVPSWIRMYDFETIIGKKLKIGREEAHETGDRDPI